MHQRKRLMAKMSSGFIVGLVPLLCVVLSRSEGIAWRIWHARGTGRDDHASFGSKRLARLTSSAQLDTAWYPFEAFVFSQVYLTVDDSSAVICIDVEGFFSPLKAFVEGAVQAGSAVSNHSASQADPPRRFIAENNSHLITFLDTPHPGKTLAETAVALATHGKVDLPSLGLVWEQEG
jgi:hypothetical protein